MCNIPIILLVRHDITLSELFISIGVALFVSAILIFFLLVFTGIFSIIGLGILALAIIGIVYAYNGEDKELPVIGQFKILK